MKFLIIVLLLLLDLFLLVLYGASGHKIKTTDIFSYLSPQEISLEQLEQKIIRTAMLKSRENVSEAARMMGISRATLEYRLKKMMDAQRN